MMGVGGKNMDNILKMTIYWHLKYSCKSLFFMNEWEKERECRKIVEIISKDPELWEFLKRKVEKLASEEELKSLDLKLTMKGLKISPVERAIFLGVRDANYLIRLQERENMDIPLLTKFI